MKNLICYLTYTVQSGIPLLRVNDLDFGLSCTRVRGQKSAEFNVYKCIPLSFFANWDLWNRACRNPLNSMFASDFRCHLFCKPFEPRSGLMFSQA